MIEATCSCGDTRSVEDFFIYPHESHQDGEAEAEIGCVDCMVGRSVTGISIAKAAHLLFNILQGKETYQA